MALFGEPVDRFFVGKLLVGLLFVVSIVQLLRAIVALTGSAAFLVRAPSQSAFFYGLTCILWALVFRLIEARRVKSRAAAVARDRRDD